jgi:hypothetical protein
MSLHNFTSLPHLHAAARRQDLLAEADKVRLISAVRSDRPGSAGVRRQLGTVLIRAGELVRGPVVPVAKAA